MAAPAPEMQQEFRQEEERLDRSRLLLTLAGLVVLLFVLAGAAVLLLQLFGGAHSTAATVGTRPAQEASVDDLHSGLFAGAAAGEALKQRQRTELGRYGWVDRDHGVVHLPIDVAMDVVAKEAP